MNSLLIRDREGQKLGFFPTEATHAEIAGLAMRGAGTIRLMLPEPLASTPFEGGPVPRMTPPVTLSIVRRASGVLDFVPATEADTEALLPHLRDER